VDAAEIAGREAGLHKDLSTPQLVMIGLGGAIGTGLFMGSGVAIGYAGPAVILSYAIAAIAAVAMVFSLSEMAVVHPAAGSFGTYAETYLNPWAGFVVRYTYWAAQSIAIGGEVVWQAGLRLKAEILGAAARLLQAEPEALDLVAGEIVLRHGRCTRLDEDSVYAEAAELAARDHADNAPYLAETRNERPAFQPLILEILQKDTAINRFASLT